MSRSALVLSQFAGLILCRVTMLYAQTAATSQAPLTDREHALLGEIRTSTGPLESAVLSHRNSRIAEKGTKHGHTRTDLVVRGEATFLVARKALAESQCRHTKRAGRAGSGLDLRISPAWAFSRPVRR